MMRAIATAGLSDIEKSVVKATYDDELKPKEKHVLYYNFLEYFEKRVMDQKWNVVLKSLIVLHRLSVEGAERFMQDLAQHTHLFQLAHFMDQSSIISQEYSRFIREFSSYLLQKCYVYNLLHVCIERRPPAESKSWALQLSANDLVKSLPALSVQFDKLIACQPYNPSDLTHPIIVSCMSVMVKDAFRIYSLLTVEMLVVLEKYPEMSLEQSKLMLKNCEKFLDQNEKFKKWVSSLDELGFASSKLMPNFDAILRDHIAVLSGQKPSSSTAKQEEKTPSKAAKPSKKSVVQESPAKPAKAAPAPPPERDAFDSDSEEEQSSEEERNKKKKKHKHRHSAAAAAPAPAPPPPPAAPVSPAAASESDDEEERKPKKKKEKKPKDKKQKKKKHHSDEEEPEETADNGRTSAGQSRPSQSSFLDSRNDPFQQWSGGEPVFGQENNATQPSAAPVSQPITAQPTATPSPYGYAPPPYASAAPYGYAPQQAYYASAGYPPPYGAMPAPAAGYPNAAAQALSQLTPLSSSSSRPHKPVSSQPQPQPSSDPFADLGPQFGATDKKGKK